MKIYLRPLTVGSSGGGLKGNLKNLDSIIQSELDSSGFESSFDELWLSIAYPPMYLPSGGASMIDIFRNNYEGFPYSRFSRRYKKIEIILKAPEFSEHFHKHDSLRYRQKFEIEERYKDLADTALANILIDKYKEAGDLIKGKLRKEDNFDHVFFEYILESIRKKISIGFLKELSVKKDKQINQEHLLLMEEKRLQRKKTRLPKTRLIQDIRLSFKYTLPQSLFYLNRYTDIVLKKLIEKDFRCPVYHHLYISIANTRDDALWYAFAVEDWHTYGIAVLNENELLNAVPAKQQTMILNVIRDGLMDIAALDGLDTDKILDAISEARELGILGELLFKTKENKRIIFNISTKPIEGINENEIYFTVIDKQTGRMAKWKFGQENIYLIGGWFGTINVTNRKITTKPRANMDLVLKGKEKSIVIDVESALNDPDKRIDLTSHP